MLAVLSGEAETQPLRAISSSSMIENLFSVNRHA